MNVDWMSVATLIAVLVGPVLAVVVTRFIDDQRADRARKQEIFRSLMRTRRMPIHVDHVTALNLVEVEFYKSPDVLRAWKDYLGNLSTPLPPMEEKDRYDAATQKRDNMLTKLIYEISRVLRFPVEQLDILEGNYIPQGWHDQEWEQTLVRRGLINVLHGKSPIQFQPLQAAPGGVYPPAPTIDGQPSPKAKDRSES